MFRGTFFFSSIVIFSYYTTVPRSLVFWSENTDLSWWKPRWFLYKLPIRKIRFVTRIPVYYIHISTLTHFRWTAVEWCQFENQICVLESSKQHVYYVSCIILFYPFETNCVGNIILLSRERSLVSSDIEKANFFLPFDSLRDVYLYTYARSSFTRSFEFITLLRCIV